MQKASFAHPKYLHYDHNAIEAGTRDPATDCCTFSANMLLYLIEKMHSIPQINVALQLQNEDLHMLADVKAAVRFGLDMHEIAEYHVSFPGKLDV